MLITAIATRLWRPAQGADGSSGGRTRCSTTAPVARRAMRRGDGGAPKGGSATAAAAWRCSCCARPQARQQLEAGDAERPGAHKRAEARHWRARWAIRSPRAAASSTPAGRCRARARVRRRLAALPAHFGETRRPVRRRWSAASSPPARRRPSAAPCVGVRLRTSAGRRAGGMAPIVRDHRPEQYAGAAWKMTIASSIVAMRQARNERLRQQSRTPTAAPRRDRRRRTCAGDGERPTATARAPKPRELPGATTRCRSSAGDHARTWAARASCVLHQRRLDGVLSADCRDGKRLAYGCLP